MSDTKAVNQVDEKKLRRVFLALTVIKIVMVLFLSGVITYMTDQFQYFEEIEPSVEYGIWHGFPFPFYFGGYHVAWGDGVDTPVAEWNPISQWNYVNLVGDFVIYTILVGGILFLVEKGLKKIFKIEW